MGYHFRNLVFEGGGVKGIAYVGSLQALEEKGILQNVARVGGASAGAITAILVGLNYSVREVNDILRRLDFNSFQDDSHFFPVDAVRLFNKYGWYKGDAFRKWIGDIIKEKTGNSEATFKDAQGLKNARGFRDLYFVGTNLSTRFEELFSFELTPDLPIADAVRISMSIPLFFASQRRNNDIYVDGGVLDNYPVKLFDSKKFVETAEHFLVPAYYDKRNVGVTAEAQYVYNKETLGFRLDSAQEIAVFRDHENPQHNKIDSFLDYLKALMGTIMESQQSQHLHGDDWQRTIYIDTIGVRTTDFDLSDEKKEALVKSGKENTEKYFAWYDDPANKALNRV